MIGLLKKMNEKKGKSELKLEIDRINSVIDESYKKNNEVDLYNNESIGQKIEDIGKIFKKNQGPILGSRKEYSDSINSADLFEKTEHSLIDKWNPDAVDRVNKITDIPSPKISVMVTDVDKWEVKQSPEPLHHEPHTKITEGIANVYTSMFKLVNEKNRRYGNSVMEPLGIFNSFVSEKNNESLNGILIRLDDKLKRIKNSKELRKNDVSDLLGYLAFLCVDQGWEDFTDLLD